MLLPIFFFNLNNQPQPHIMILLNNLHLNTFKNYPSNLPSLPVQRGFNAFFFFFPLKILFYSLKILQAY